MWQVMVEESSDTDPLEVPLRIEWRRKGRVSRQVALLPLDEAAIRELLAPYVFELRSGDAVAPVSEMRSVCRWAERVGIEVGVRGRIAQAVLEQYNRAYGTNVANRSSRGGYVTASPVGVREQSRAVGGGSSAGSRWGTSSLSP